MRAPAPLPALVGALALTLPVLAGCGSEDAASPLDAALGYLPSDAPMVAVVATDPDDAGLQALEQLTNRLPGDAQPAESVVGTVLPAGLDFEEQIAPLLGNELVVGVPDAQALAEEGFVAAIQAPDSDAAQSVADGTGVSEVGESEGATIYAVEGGALAIDDDVVLFADTRERLETTLAQRAAGDGNLDQPIFDEAIAELGPDAPVRGYADAAAVLAAVPEVQQARAVAWIAAVQTLRFTLSGEGDRLALELDLATDPAGLTDGDLPIAASPNGTPRVLARPGDLGVGIAEPGQTLRFGRLLADALAPGGLELVESQLGISVDELARQVGDEAFLSFGSEPGGFLRVDLRDPRGFEVALARIARVLPLLTAAVGLEGLALDRVGSPGGAMYELELPGMGPATIGVLDGALVVVDDSDQVAEIAAATPRKGPGTEGSVVVAGNGQLLLEHALSPLAGLLGGDVVRAFIEPAGAVEGSLEADTSGIRGRFTLTIAD